MRDKDTKHGPCRVLFLPNRSKKKRDSVVQNAVDTLIYMDLHAFDAYYMQKNSKLRHI